MPSKDEKKNENENEKQKENEKQNKLLNNDNNANAKNKKTSTSTKKARNKKEDENKNNLLEYMGDVDDKLFKEYSNDKDFNSFIDKFDHAANNEDKKTVVQKLKDINNIVNHYAQMEDDYSE